MTPRPAAVLGWYFSTADRRLRYDDNRMIVSGESHTVDCRPILCEQGLHASPKALQALEYAPGPILWRVELRGTIVTGADKACATERHYIAGFDATDMLRAFARKCALQVIHLWDAPRVVRDYLETGDESIQAAAGDAAWAAAWDAARDAARTASRGAASAAWDAAWNATRDAASAATRDAASAAAGDAAWAAARAAARAAAWDAARDAARDAAWAAALAAAWDAQSAMLEEMALAEIAALAGPRA